MSIKLVVGPPGAGKTTHIKEHAQPNDLVIDLDEIQKVTGTRESARRVRGALESTAKEYKEGDVWIARTLPNPQDRQPFMERVGVEELILLDSLTAEEAKARVEERDGNQELFSAIDKWYEYTTNPENSDKELTMDNPVNIEDPTPTPDKTEGGKPISEMTVEEELAYWKSHARRHEKNNKDLLAQLKGMEEPPAPVNEPEANPLLGKLFDAEFRAAALNHPGVDFSELKQVLSPSQFSDAEGGIDGEKLSALLGSLAPVNTPQPSSLGNLGRKDTPEKVDELAAGKAEFLRRHGK